MAHALDEDALHGLDLGIIRAMLAALARAYRLAGAIPAPNLDWAVDRADSLRTWGLRALPRGAAGLWVGRERRAASLGVVMLAVALGLAVTFPVALIAVGPLVYGVPHILSDVRYLLARPGLSKRPLFLGALAIGCLLAVLGYGVRGALVGAALGLAASRAPAWKKAAGAGIAAGLFGLCQWAGWYSDLAFVHLHNFVGLTLWLLWRDRVTKLHWVFTGAVLCASTAILLGAATPILARTNGFAAPWTDLTFRDLAYSVSPTPYGPWAERLLVLYAFAQAAHYIVWLRLVPEDDRPSPAPRSYRRTYAALVADVGGGVMWITLLTMAALAVWACASIGGARNGYLTAAFFHAHLEVVALAVLWAEGRWPHFERHATLPSSA